MDNLLVQATRIFFFYFTCTAPPVNKTHRLGVCSSETEKMRRIYLQGGGLSFCHRRRNEPSFKFRAGGRHRLKILSADRTQIVDQCGTLSKNKGPEVLEGINFTRHLSHQSSKRHCPFVGEYR